jgi:hypothetical protein
MFFSQRGTSDYRTSRETSYKIGYAVSNDGLSWRKQDPDVGIHRSEAGWDSDMIENCSIYERRGQQVMLYNGNGFGKTGFGYAVRDIVRPGTPR